MKSINLLPPKMSKQQLNNPQLIPLLYVLAVVLLAGQVYYYFSWKNEASVLQEQAAASSIQAEELQSSGEAQSKVDQFNQAAAVIKQLQQERPDWLPYLASLVGYLPAASKVNYMSVSEGGDSIQAEIEFKLFEDSVLYLQKLEEAPRLSGMILTTYKKESLNDAASSAEASSSVFKVLVEVKLDDQLRGGTASGAAN